MDKINMTKHKRGLGRGLDALLSISNVTQDKEIKEVDEITTNDIVELKSPYTAIGFGVLSFNVDLDSAESTVTRAFAGGRTTFTITHSLGTLDIKPEVFRLSDGRTIGWRIERTGINTIEASRNGNVADGLFRLII